MESAKSVQSLVQKRFGLAEDAASSPLTLLVEAAQLVEVCHFLHDDPAHWFDFLSCLSGVDNGPEARTMEVIYHLYSIPHDHYLTLKVRLPRNREGESLPEVPSVTPIWPGADWPEREVFDLIGIRFTGHLNLRRILCPDDWVGHPLRRDYVVQSIYHGLPVPYDQHNERNGHQPARDVRPTFGERA